MTGRIIVADGHPLFHEDILSILQRLLPEARIGEAGDLAEILRLAGEGEQSGSLILDLRFPDLARTEMLTDLRHRFSRTTLVVVSMVGGSQPIGEVMSVGTDGFFDKSIAPEELGRAILAIHAGRVLVCYEPSGLLPLQPSPRLKGLIERQLDVLRLLARSRGDEEIGRTLNISYYTARIHMLSLLRVLDVSSRVAAAVKYRTALRHSDRE